MLIVPKSSNLLLLFIYLFIFAVRKSRKVVHIEHPALAQHIYDSGSHSSVTCVQRSTSNTNLRKNSGGWDPL